MICLWAIIRSIGLAKVWFKIFTDDGILNNIDSKRAGNRFQSLWKKCYIGLKGYKSTKIFI